MDPGDKAQRTLYRFGPAVFAPAVLGIAAIVWAVEDDLWILTTIPFIAIGSICSSPNMDEREPPEQDC
jgi:hypothetical protein